MSEKAITKEQIDKVLSKYGFICHGFASDHSMYMYTLLGLSISVKIYPNTNEFEICHMIDESILFLSSPVCSPFYEDIPKYKQFEKIFAQFMRVYNKLL